uniref:E3 SUMO-protein ligase SIZ1 n=1 Tax=Cajanus cajan TaxID=3821 RepID=A0A151S2U4_CAJCA|nr:E3 SUMO-protein ligase SIZ1 [Cajanus cajan]
MQISGATDLASKGQGASDSSSVKVKGEFDVKVKGEFDDSFQPDAKIRCLCGSRLEIEDLVKVYH